MMKKTPIILIYILIALFVILSAASCGGSDTPDGVKTLAFEISGDKSGMIFAPEGTGKAKSEVLDETLTVRNLSDNDYSFTLFITSNGGKSEAVFDVAATSSAEKNVTGGTLEGISVSISGEGGRSVYYAFTKNAFENELKRDGQFKDVILTVDLSFDALRIERILNIGILNSKLSAKQICIECADEGTMVISEEGSGELDADKVFADAEKLTLKMPSIKKIVANPSYYLRVYSYNGRIIDTKTITVNSENELSALVDENTLPRLYPETTIVLSGQYTVPEKLSFSFPVSLCFKNGVTLENPALISTDKECEITVSSDGKCNLPDFPVDINASGASVTWDVPRKDGITMLDIVSHLGVKTVNGIAPENYVLGGEGTSELVNVAVYKSKNKNMTKDILFTADGYVFTAVVDSIIDTETLRNAVVSATATNGGKVVFDDTVLKGDKVDLLFDSGCYLNVIDKNGKSSRYLLKTEYKPSALPVVVINTESGEDVASNEEYENATFYMNTDGCPMYEGIPLSEIQIRGRGHSTWKWDKKPYKIKFDSKVSVFGLEDHKQWTLLANYSDKSLIRNTVALEAAKILSGLSYTPSQYPVDVFFNGEYVGIYSMGEQLQANTGRVELADNGSDVDTGYLLEIGGTSSADVWNETCFYTTLCKYVKVKAPDEGTLTKDQVAYIKDWVTKADKAVMEGKGYEEYIDMTALIDWVIIHELSYNIDCSFRRSCYFTKDAGGKLTMGPVWDFDNAFGNFWKDDKTYSTWATADTTSDYIWDNWMCYLINDPNFREMFRERWDEVKYAILENMRNTVKVYSELCSRSATYNFQKWDILNKRVGCEDSSIKQYNTYEKQISYLSNFIETRWSWLDENI